jgi:tryptophan-rich sensory protein
MKKIFKKNIVIIGLTFLIPGIISFLIKDSFSTYKELMQPKFSPPTYIFPIAWSILYLLMSIAAILTKENDKCLKIYYLQLFLNIIWTPIFFLFNNYLLALIDLLILLGTVLYMTYLFYKENNKTIYLLLPYIIWLSFALYLNYFVYLKN